MQTRDEAIQSAVGEYDVARKAVEAAQVELADKQELFEQEKLNTLEIGMLTYDYDIMF